MSGLPIEALTDRERLIVRDAREEIAAAPPVTDLGYMGCPAALLGVAILIFWPKVLSGVPGAAFFTPFAMLAGVLMVLGGPVLGLTSGGFVRGASTAAVEAALRQLESLEPDRDVMLRAATLLISHAFVSHGPTTSQTYEPDLVMTRVRRVLPLIVAVEEYLVADFDVSRVFTGAGADHGDFLP